jgi:hypothetical protein
MVDLNKRRFFGNLFRLLLREARGIPQETACEQAVCDDQERFFESYESCYSLALAYPEELMLESARRAGIEVQGRERIDIVRELFSRRREG